jgi:hypothetical protein
MSLLRHTKQHRVRRADLKQQVSLVKPVAANITRVAVKAADGLVNISIL